MPESNAQSMRKIGTVLSVRAYRDCCPGIEKKLPAGRCNRSDPVSGGHDLREA